MPFNPFCEAECFLGLKHFIESRRSMCIQVIEDESNFRCRSIFLIQQVFETLGKILFRPCCLHVSMAPTSLGLKHQEGTTSTIARKLRIFTSRTAWLRRLWRLEMSDQLAGTFINTDNWRGFIIGLQIQVQEILHTPDKLSTDLGNTPFFLQPGFEFVFFKTRRTVSSEISSTTFSWTSLFAKSCIVQHVRPSGASLQANATR